MKSSTGSATWSRVSTQGRGVGGIRSEVDVGGLTHQVGGLTQDVGGLTHQVGGLTQDVGGLTHQVGGLTQDVGDLKIGLAVVRAELAMVKWMVSGVGFGMLLLLVRTFWPA